MDFELSKKQTEWCNAVQTFGNRIYKGRDPGTLWTEEELAIIAKECMLAGFLLPGPSRNPGPSPDLETATTVVQELSFFDAAIGFVAASRYLCGRAVSHVLDVSIRDCMEEILVSAPSALGPQWMHHTANGEGEAFVVSLGNAPALFVGLEPAHEDASCQPALVVVPGWEDHTYQDSTMSGVGLDALQFRRIRRDALRGANCSIAWYCGRQEFSRIWSTLEAERAILFSAMVLGAARRAQEYALEYSRQRQAFGKPICQHQAVMLRLADIALANESSQLMLRDAVTCPQEKRVAVAVRAWVHCREAGLNAVLHAGQLLGGHGYLKLHPVEKWLRDIQCLRTLFGNRNGQSSCHPCN